MRVKFAEIGIHDVLVNELVANVARPPTHCSSLADLGGGGGGGGGKAMPPLFLWYARMCKSLSRVTYEPSRNAIKWNASITSFFSI